MADAFASDVDEMSDNEVFDRDTFDLVQIRDREREFHDFFGDSDDETDFEGFEPEYIPPDFSTWNWDRDFQESDRKAFDSRTGPVQVDFADNGKQAIDYFKLFYSDEVFDHIALQTNENANRKRESDPDNNKGEWHDVTREVIMAFYGICILMDIIKCDRDEMYWYSGQFWLVRFPISTVFSRDRFFQIRRYLHFNDDTPVPGDKLYKVRYMLDHMRLSFQANYLLHREVTVDEAMVPYKGRLSFKQYMKDKPVKFGIKVWVLADSVTGYCWNYDVYVGKNGTEIDRRLGLAAQVVVQLTKDIIGKGHVIYTDNFYTSPTLAHYLLQKDTYLCGTIRNNRKGFPAFPTGRDANRLERGTTEWLASGDFVATMWKDNKPVYFLTTAHAPEDQHLTTKRRKKDGSEDVLPCTPCVKDYGKYMGGVDRLDQCTRMNKSKKTMRWYRRVEIKLREIAIYNAYVIEGSTTPHRQDGMRKRDMLNFKLDLVHQLVGDFRQERRQVGRSRSEEHTTDRLDNNSHWPEPSGSRNTVCVVCQKKHSVFQSANPGVTYADNPFKRSKTTLKCSKCDVPLCVSATKSCFKDYHTKVQYWR